MKLRLVVVSLMAISAMPALAETIHGVDVGDTVLLAQRTETSGYTLGANPDRECSPGAYYSKLTKSRICTADFRTDPIGREQAARSRVTAAAAPGDAAEGRLGLAALYKSVYGVAPTG